MNPRLSSHKTPSVTRARKALEPTVRRSSPAIEHAIVDLQRVAGNAAVTDLLSSLQRDSALATKPAAAPPAASPGIETVPIDRLDALAAVVPKRKYDAVAIVPTSVASAPASAPISVLLHLHGINIPYSYEDALGVDGEVPPEYQMQQQLQAFVGNRADTRMIGLLPVGKTTSREIEKKDGTKRTVHGVTFGQFNTEALVDQAIKRLVEMKRLPEKSTANGVVLSAHSGGGLDMLRAASTAGKKRLIGMFGFESINNDFGAYLAFLKKKLAEALKELGNRQAPADASQAAAEAAFQAQRQYLTQEAFRYVGESGPTYQSVYRLLHDAIYGGKNQKGWMVENDAELRQVAGSHYDEIRALFAANYRINAEETVGHRQILQDRFQQALETLPSAGAPTKGTAPAGPAKSPTPPPGNVAPQPEPAHGAAGPSSPAAGHAGGLTETLDRIGALTGFGGGWLLALLGGATPIEAALMQVIAAGVRDSARLTDLVWYLRHPGSGPIAPDDAASKKEWNQIRSTIVRPALARAGARAPATSLPPAPTATPAESKPTGTPTPGPIPATKAAPPSTAPAPSAPTSTASSNSAGAKLAAHYTLSDEDRLKIDPLRADLKDLKTAGNSLDDLQAALKKHKRAPTADEAERMKTLEAEKTRLSTKILAAWGSWDAVSAALAKSDIEKDVVVKGKMSLAEWYAGIDAGATFLGRVIDASGGASKGVHKELLAKLQQAEALLRAEPKPGTLGVGAEGAAKMGESIKLNGLRPPKAATGGERPSMHCYGLAVDINYYGNPFVGLSGGGASPAVRMIKHATQLISGQEVNTRQSAKSLDATAAGEMWDKLRGASDDLKTYLNLRDDGSDTGVPATATEDVAKQYLGWHVARNGGSTSLKEWRKALKADVADSRRGDFLAQGSYDVKRDPKLVGIMDLPKALVQALVQAGLLWGGLYSGAKDIMHFDYRSGTIKR